MRASILRSPRRSARKHSSALGISDRSVRKILHDVLHLHPYKMVIVHEPSERDFNSRMNACEGLLEVVPEDAIVFFFLVMKPIFIYVDPSTDKTCTTGLEHVTPILESCIKGLCIQLKSQCDGQFPQLELLVPGSLRKIKPQ